MADESEEHLIKAEKKAKKQQQELQRVKQAKECLERHGHFLSSVSSFWSENLNEASN